MYFPKNVVTVHKGADFEHLRQFCIMTAEYEWYVMVIP